MYIVYLVDPVVNGCPITDRQESHYVDPQPQQQLFLLIDFECGVMGRKSGVCLGQSLVAVTGRCLLHNQLTTAVCSCCCEG